MICLKKGAISTIKDSSTRLNVAMFFALELVKQHLDPRSNSDLDLDIQKEYRHEQDSNL